MMSSPSYSALRTFVEVGRHGSLKAAAQQLSVTSGAVSQQIKMLERVMGTKLVERRVGGVKLSAQGLRLFRELAAGFEQIDACIARLKGGRASAGALVVSTTPSFAACWLTSRLGAFTDRHPGNDLRLETSIALSKLTGHEADVAIRHGSGHYPGLHTTLLFEPHLIAIAKPGYVRKAPLSPAQCLRYPLLQDRDRSAWIAWLHGADVSPALLTTAADKGPSYADDALLIEAAAAGQGLAVVHDIYASDALAAGRVVRVSDRRIRTDAAYYLVTRPPRMATARAKAFCRWLLQQKH